LYIVTFCCITNSYIANSGSVPEDVITGKKKEITKLEELPLFKFEKLSNATNNFHFGNMLGKGGFGPVYKVIFFV